MDSMGAVTSPTGAVACRAVSNTVPLPIAFPSTSARACSRRASWERIPKRSATNKARIAAIGTQMAGREPSLQIRRRGRFTSQARTEMTKRSKRNQFQKSMRPTSEKGRKKVF